MREKPILFSAPMVQAILAGTKTHTRRVVKSTGMYAIDADIHGADIAKRELERLVSTCPYGKASDQLWVRETWNHDCYPYPISDNPIIHYRADYLDDPLGADLELSKDGIRRKWMPSIYMPRKASRIQLEITDIRVERLNDCSESDAIAEGIKGDGLVINGISEGQHWYDYIMETDDKCEWYTNPINSYKSLWESINGAGSWAANPWVWVIEFKRINHG